MENNEKTMQNNEKQTGRKGEKRAWREGGAFGERNRICERRTAHRDGAGLIEENLSFPRTRSGRGMAQ